MKVHYLILCFFSFSVLPMDKQARNSQFPSNLQQPFMDYSEQNDIAWGLKPQKQYVHILYEDDPGYSETNPNGYESVRIPESTLLEDPGCCETCCAPCLGRFLDCLAHICCLK